jgi:hypothetical protein
MGKRDRDDSSDEEQYKKKHKKKHDNDKNKEDLEKQLEELHAQVELKKQQIGVSEFITEDDYFKKNAEFRVWLLQSKSILSQIII